MRGSLYFASALMICCCAAGVTAAESPDKVTAEQARFFSTDSGVRGGLIVQIGVGDGQLTAALARGPHYYSDDEESDVQLISGFGYLVQGLDRDPANVAKARETIHSKRRYGRVCVDFWRGSGLPYADNVVNLLIVGEGEPVPREEMLRVLAPGGAAYVFGEGKWTKTVNPWPAEIDEWTHYLHGPDNNAVAEDTVVGPPKHYQWIAEPKWARSHDHLSTTSALVSAGGRIFYIIDEGPTAFAAMDPKWTLVARDAFSGVLLWKWTMASWEGHLRGFRSGPAALARRLVAVGDRVYVTLGYGRAVTALDAATGKQVACYRQTKGAMELVVHDGTLFAVVGDRLPDNTDGADKPGGDFEKWMHWPIYREEPPQKHLVAVNVETRDLLWKKDDADTHGLMPTTLAVSGDRVIFHSGKDVLSLDAASGNEIWRAARPVNTKRPSWSAPTLVVTNGVVLCADRALDAVHPGAKEEDDSPQWIVSSQGGIAPEGTIEAFDAATGKPLWTAPCKESYNSPVDVLVADGLVWSGELTHNREPGITRGIGLKTGKIDRQRPPDKEFFKIVMNHHRCYRNKATVEYLVLGRDGTEFIDIDTGEGFGHPFVRGACQYGVMPCNGLLYSPSHSCACHIESKLNGFVALAPQRKTAGSNPSATPRLERGPAYDWLARGDAASKRTGAAWPTYRHDAARGGATATRLPKRLARIWTADLGAAGTQPVVADGRVIVATPENHAVHALDAATGDALWTFTAGAAVDSSPTLYAGTVLFGSADGSIYCLRAEDGALVWRFRAAPEDRRFVAYERVESAWPVHGSVLVLEGDVYAVAGRSVFLDGGMRLVRLNATTGELVLEKRIDTDALPDVLSSDGENVFLRHLRMNKDGEILKPTVPHLYGSVGFLDDSWWHRTYWQFGTFMRSAYGGWPIVGSRVPAGRLLVMNSETIVGFGRFNQYSKVGGHVGLGRIKYLLYATKKQSADRDAKARRRGTDGNDVPAIWTVKIPILARGMVLCGDTLFVAGPPDLLVQSAEDVKDPYHVPSPRALAEQQAAIEGRSGATLLAVSASDGKTAADYPLHSPPVWDGLSAADGRLFIATTAGRVVCFGE